MPFYATDYSVFICFSGVYVVRLRRVACLFAAVWKHITAVLMCYLSDCEVVCCENMVHFRRMRRRFPVFWLPRWRFGDAKLRFRRTKQQFSVRFRQLRGWFAAKMWCILGECMVGCMYFGCQGGKMRC